MRTIFIFFFIYCLLLIVIRQYWPDGILFYQGTLLALAHALAYLSIMLFIKSNTHITVLLKDGLLIFLLSYTFMFTIPTTVDRSYSVHMLNQIAASSNGVTEEALIEDFKTRFITGGAVNRRIEEQLATGSIIRKDNLIKLTPRGHFLTNTFHLFCVAFSCSE